MRCACLPASATAALDMPTRRTMITYRAALQSGTFFVAQFSLFLAASLTPLFASGQQATAPGDAPPQLEKLEEGEAPAVTIPGREPRHSITETRDRGTVTNIRVESGNSTYYIRPQSSVGSALPGDGQSTVTRPAQWQILEWESGSKNQAPQGDAAATVPPPPPLAPDRK
jgi:hypothetical protein